uniref:Ensconsin, isoform F n=1 Tax=Drosophila melanogaster TaxID=7227 RepID=A8JNK1_DROME|nr:ensconsin, isoform F [Drosophila melanogaster]ABW08457.1 ensconsin, isoform F [Drosophila melanogaster]|eukprot:NP_001097498.1 ensconsin, isoform F [Drosophila melanogaster]
MASLGGQHGNISTNPEVENTAKRPESREGSAERKAHAFAPAKISGCSAGATLHWFAQVGGQISASEDDSQASKDREEKLKYARDRQNEERHRKIEELRAQAEAAQRYREQKEEERRRRIEEIRTRDTEKRHQVEERKKAIFEAEKERREYILKKNQERESRIEVKKRDRNSIGFAFGSSTPRLLDVPADYGLVSPSAFWGQRRSTSISNVAGASLTRRSSERELADSGAKKRASSSTDRQDDHRRKSSSMYEVFNWGYSNDEPPKRFSLSIAGSEINIDGPANPHPPPTSKQTANAHRPTNLTTTTATSTTTAGHNNFNNNNSYRKEDSVDSSPMVFRSVYRRKTDLMPTIPSPRDGHYGSRGSLSSTPARTPGRAYSMNRLDQLAQPIRRNGEHMRAILERERRERELEMLDETASLGGGGGRRGAGSSARARRAGSAGSGSSSAAGIMSRSMTHLAGGGGQRERGKYSLGGGISTSFRPLASGAGGQRDSTSKSMTQISSWSVYGSTAPQQPPPNHLHHLRQSTLGLQTAATKKYLQSSFASASSFNSASFRANATGRGRQQQYAISTNPHRFLDLDPNSLLLMNSASLLVNAGSRSGNATPGGHFNNSRPGSAMSTSTNMSTSGLVPRRPATAPRKPRPASIAGTGMSLEEINKLKRDQKPPVKTTAASPSAQTTPKRTANLMSTSLIVTSSSSRLSSAEKKTPSKREPPVPKAASASKALPSRTASSERISRLTKEPKTKDTSAMTRSMIVTSSSTSTITKPAPAPVAPTSAPVPEQNGVAKEVEKTTADEPVPEAEVPTEAPVVVPSVSKAEKEALNTEKTEEGARQEEEQILAVESVPEALVTSINVEEKSDEGNEKEVPKPQEQAAPKKPSRSKENSEVRELTPPEGADLMTASMMAKKITTEEEAKAALAERRRLAREEAERQAELERQRLEAERLAEIKAQEEEAERQRLFEEESTRLAEEQRRGEEERLRKAIEEAQQREEEEKRRREEEEKQRVEREEAEKKAKEEAEKQRVEVAERLKREEKEREERRKRVEAIMLRTRKGGAATTPSKDANDKAAPAATAPENNSSSNSSVTGSSNNSAEGSPSAADSTPAPTATETVQEAPNSQAMYEQSVLDKENSLINSFSTMIIDENAKNLQQVSNGKLLVDFESTNTVPAVANGNGHIENVNNKNDINLLQDVVAPVATQLIDLSIESQDLHLNNNNSLLTSTAATTTLVTADSHENKDISLL